MALCAKCGRNLGVGGKRVQKSHEIVTATVRTLRKWQQEALEDGLAKGVDAAELQTLRTDSDRMIQLGERFADDLHTVSHQTSVPLVDYSLLKRWMDNALELLKP